MEEHRGDLGGFAVAEGFTSVHPGIQDGRPVLRISRTEPQRSYAPVAQEGSTGGGSSGRQKRRPADRSKFQNPKK
jgi:hypothetical protein